MSDRMLRCALFYAKRDLAVFPIWPVVQFRNDPPQSVCTCNLGLRCTNPGKHPMGNLVRHGVSEASTDPEKIKHWWRGRPDANVGIGCRGKLVVLDIDPKHNGTESLAALERQHGALPQTWKARTGSGGFHHYFAADTTKEIRNSVSKIASGLDVRGNGGYVVAPPSKHITGREYVWEFAPHRVALAPLPAWLLEATLSTAPKAAALPEAWRDLVAHGVAEGARNDRIAKLVGHLLRRRVDPIVAHELMQVWNAGRCRPPLPASEITKIVASISHREEQRQKGLRA